MRMSGCLNNIIFKGSLGSTKGSLASPSAFGDFYKMAIKCVTKDQRYWRASVEWWLTIKPASIEAVRDGLGYFQGFVRIFWVQVYLDVPILRHRVSDTAVYAKSQFITYQTPLRC